MRVLNWWHFAGILAIGAALGAIGGYISGLAKFAKFAKLAKFVSFGYAKDYYICIIWSDTSVLDSNDKWIRGCLK